MIELARHIEILLLSNDCVIVPDFGGFMTHHVDAHYDDTDDLFLPPLRTLGFNPQLTMNDSLIAQSYVEAYDISYPEAIRRIEEEVNELKQHLETDGFVEFNDIGTLTLNEEGHYEFAPCEAGVLTPSLYGLSSFELQKLDNKLTGNHQPLRAKHHNADEQFVMIRRSWLRNAIAIAAAIIAFIFITPPVANSDFAQVQRSSIVPFDVAPATRPLATSTIVEDSVSADEQQAQSTDSVTISADAQSEIVETVNEDTEKMEAKPLAKTYCIVLASQVRSSNATDYVERLKKSGFDDAYLFKRNNMIRVVYGNFSSEAEAYNTLHTLRAITSEFDEAWVLKK